MAGELPLSITGLQPASNSVAFSRLRRDARYRARIVLTCALTSVLTIGGAVAASAQSTEAVDAARSAAAVGLEWLGSHPEPNPDLSMRGPLWQGPGAMVVEQRVAQRVIRSWWPAAIADARAAAMLDGFAWYLQGHAVERMFDRRYLRLAHSVESRPYLGAHLVWSFPTLRLSRFAVAPRDRYAAVFAGLERRIGQPNLQGAMFEVARLTADRLTARAIVMTISDAAGQDVSWAFDAADADMNYAVTGLSSSDAPGCAAPCVDTTVSVARDGAGMFTGRSAPRTGEFDSGDAILLQVTLADGTSSSVRWDGRDQSRTFQFRGPSPATAVYLDPDRVVMIDRNRLDNAIVTPSPTNVPVRKWAARWMVWLQHTMLSYGFLA